jgi:hypothetical protein
MTVISDNQNNLLSISKLMDSLKICLIDGVTAQFEPDTGPLTNFPLISPELALFEEGGKSRDPPAICELLQAVQESHKMQEILTSLR